MLTSLSMMPFSVKSVVVLEPEVLRQSDYVGGSLDRLAQRFGHTVVNL